MRFRSRPAATIAAVTIALTVPAGGCRDTDAPPPSGDDSTLAPDFTLTDQHGRSFSLHAQRGRLVLLYFGYTYCPDVCPTTLSGWRQVEDELGPAAKDVEFVFVTVDPDRDSAERLERHLAVFSPRFVGLRGTAEELAPVFDAYHVVPRRVPISEGAGGYLMDHPNEMTLIDRTGRIAAKFDYRKYPPEIALELRRRLEEATGPIRVSNVWSWPTAIEAAEASPGGERGPGAVYLSIRNDGDHADRLVAARSEVCAQAEIHETRHVGDRVRMIRAARGLSVPAGGSLELKPGSAHIMLVGLRRDLVPGERFELVLIFKRAGEVVVESEVREP